MPRFPPLLFSFLFLFFFYFRFRVGVGAAIGAGRERGGTLSGNVQSSGWDPGGEDAVDTCPWDAFSKGYSRRCPFRREMMVVAVAPLGALGFQGRVCNNLVKAEKQER